MDDRSLNRVRAVFTLLNLVVGWHLLYEGVAKILTPGWSSAGYLVNATGPLAGVLAGMEWATAEGYASVVSVSVDTPFLPHDLLHRLREAQGRSGLAVAASSDPGGQLRDHPTCALWPVALAGDVRAALESGLHRIGQFAAAYDPGRAVFDSQPVDPFLNVNTPEDLARAARLA